MSVRSQAWLIQSAAMVALLVGLFARNGWLLGLGVSLFVVAMFWPRCRQCGLPAFWRKKPNDPDHFVYWGQSLWPGKSCSRCGEDLTI